MCKEVCTQQIGVHGTYTMEETGRRAICIHCGQCVNVCPRALGELGDTPENLLHAAESENAEWTDMSSA